MTFEEYQFPRLLEQEPEPDWPAGLAAQHIVLNHFRAAMGWRNDVGGENSWEAVHQLRVCTRRTRTALNAFASFWDTEQVNAHRRRLSRLATSFSPSRDMDVLALYLEQIAEEKPRLAAAAGNVREMVLHDRSDQAPGLLAALTKLDREGYPTRFISYFSHRPFDMWREVPGDG